MYIIVEEFAYTKGNYREILGTIKSCLALNIAFNEILFYMG